MSGTLREEGLTVVLLLVSHFRAFSCFGDPDNVSLGMMTQTGTHLEPTSRRICLKHHLVSLPAQSLVAMLLSLPLSRPYASNHLDRICQQLGSRTKSTSLVPGICRQRSGELHGYL